MGSEKRNGAAYAKLIVFFSVLAGTCVNGDSDLLRKPSNLGSFAPLDSHVSGGSGYATSNIGTSGEQISTGNRLNSYSTNLGSSAPKYEAKKFKRPTAKYNSGTGLTQGTFDFSGAAADSSSGYGSSSYPASATSPSGNYHQGNQGQSYTYYYQHYPEQSGYGYDEGLSGGFKGIGGLGGGIGGLGAGGVKLLAVLAKGALALKPFLIIGLLALIAIPVLLLFLPIPIITITPPSATTTGSGRGSRYDPYMKSSGSILSSYITQLTEKVLNSDQCLERIMCKLPHAPEKYDKQAKSIWESLGAKFIKNERVQRGTIRNVVNNFMGL